MQCHGKIRQCAHLQKRRLTAVDGLADFEASEGPLQVSVSPDGDRHLATTVLSVDELHVQHQLLACDRVDVVVAVQHLLEVQNAPSLPRERVRHLHHLQLVNYIRYCAKRVFSLIFISI